MNQVLQKLSIGVLTGSLALALAACGATSQATSAAGTANTKLRVVATTAIVGDVVRNVAGDLVDLTVLLGPGVNSHSYQPTPQDIKTVADADLVFMNGVGYEGFMDALIKNAGGDATIASVSDGIALLAFVGDEEGHAEDEAHADGTAEADHGEEGSFDPHVWFNPQHVKIWVDTIEKQLRTADAGNAAAYATRATSYRATLDKLDQWAMQQISLIPQANRKLVTDHDTFGYLAQHYGFTLVGEVLPSISSAAEPSAQQLTAITDVIRANNVPAVFVSNEANPSLSKQVSQDTGAKLVFVYVESLSEPGGVADTYEAFMRYNIGQIVDGLK